MKPITDRQRSILREQLYSRIRIRFIPVSQIWKLSEEFGLLVIIRDIDSHVIRQITPAKIEYTCNICLWEDHYFCSEFLPENLSEYGKTSIDLVRRIRKQLRPMSFMDSSVFNQRLPEYVPQLLNAYSLSMYHTPQEMLDGGNFQQYLRGHDLPPKPRALDSITFDDISLITNHAEASYGGYTLFLKYLVEKKLNVLAISGVPKAFIKQSIHGGRVSIANNKPQILGEEEEVVGLDVNSAYPFAETQIPLPIGLPKLITSRMTWQDVFAKPIYFVECTIKRYDVQHELDIPLKGTCVLNQIDIQRLPITIDTTIPPRGYYWDNVADKRPLKDFVERLYTYKINGHPFGKTILNAHTGMLIKKAPRTYAKTSIFKDYKTHPCIARRTIRADVVCYYYYHEYDYTYNYPHVQSLILSQAKANMDSLYTECHKKNIRMLYSSTDSLYILAEDLSKMAEHLHPTELGKLKVEARGKGALFLEQGLYYINEQKYSSQYVPHENIERYCSDNDISVRDFFVKLSTNKGFLLSISRLMGSIRH